MKNHLRDLTKPNGVACNSQKWLLSATNKDCVTCLKCLNRKKNKKKNS